MRVLIVDDVEVNSAVLARLVGLCGHETFIADGGSAALELAARCHPDLVLMDIMMPEMDGYETTRRLRCELGQTVPVYAVSAAEKDAQRMDDAGMTGYFRKPLALAQIRELIGC